jgi:hypothetical protein
MAQCRHFRRGFPRRSPGWSSVSSRRTHPSDTAAQGGCGCARCDCPRSADASAACHGENCAAGRIDSRARDRQLWRLAVATARACGGLRTAAAVDDGKIAPCAGVLARWSTARVSGARHRRDHTDLGERPVRGRRTSSHVRAGRRRPAAMVRGDRPHRLRTRQSGHLVGVAAGRRPDADHRSRIQSESFAGRPALGL